jgi:Transposase
MAGRKRLLTPDLASAIAERVAAGETVEAASSSLGLSSRSVRRWRREGEQELDRLSAEAQLALELSPRSVTRL